VNLWLESLEPGKPLSFLDHRILVGNSLLGATPALMARGIPDEAFNAIEGDDKADVTRLKKLNRAERRARETGQLPLFDPPADYRALSFSWAQLDEAPDSNLSEWEQKEAYYAALRQSDDYRRACMVANAWCAAFVWDKRPETPALTDAVFNRFCADPFAGEFAAIREQVDHLNDQYHFFHWHCEFPDVFRVLDAPDPAAPIGWSGGFDCVLGNPPWEKMRIDEKDWFASREPEIANAANASARGSLIKQLKETNYPLHVEYVADQRKVDGEGQFLKQSARFPLTTRGQTNTYGLFSELNRSLMARLGRAGFIVQSDIATSDTYKLFFSDLLDARQLVSFFDFVNKEGLFPDLHRTQPHFCLVTLSGQPISDPTDFAFWNTRVDHLFEDERHFTLTSEDLTLVNPNTRTCPIFASKRDAEIVKAVYKLVPCLFVEEDPTQSEWGVNFLRMFDMSNDSGLFRIGNELLSLATMELRGNVFYNFNTTYLPLYEGKMIWQYDHRSGSFALTLERPSSVQLPPTSKTNYLDPNYAPLSWYWIDRDIVQERLAASISLSSEQAEVYNWFIVYRFSTSPENERTMISCVIPRVASNHILPCIIVPQSAQQQCAFLTNTNSFVFDYVLRNKMGRQGLDYFFLKQIPIIPPQTYPTFLLEFIVGRALELTYTAWDLQAFAQDVGYQGAPFIWDDDRRFVLRAELDALYFHLYGISRDDVDYIMETFPIVKRKDEAKFGSYITKAAILDVYDQLAALPKIEVPAPKGGGTMLVPDVSQYVTPLDPPPGDARAAHNGS
jgi:hypothetical protein